MSNDAPVTVVFTVLNEADALPRLLDSLAAQTRPPDEVIACDGGSRDNTVALLHAECRFLLKVIESPGANISRGRNLAIAAAAHPLIACTDAGVRLDPHWLERITRRFSDSEPPAWVGGFFLPDPHSTFEIAMSATVLPALADIDPAKFLPSSRSVAFWKTAWQQAGGYPEWLDYCEDLIFDFNLRAAFGQCGFAPDALVYFKPRSSLRAFFKQYYLYARGDGKADLWLKRHLARYAAYLIALLVGLLAAAYPALRIASGLLLLAGAAVYLRAPCRRLVSGWVGLPPFEKARAALFVPLIRVVGDAAKMLGYPAGLLWRWRRTNM